MKERDTGRVIILFLKHPEPGKVKSRLARDVGEGTALLLYKCMVLDTLDILNRTGIPFLIFFDPPQELVALQAWLGKSSVYLPQIGADLGERMELAFQKVFDEGAREAILIGTDIPEMNASLVDKAFGSFEQYDAVIGPANDGGYYLIGFTERSFTRQIFRNMTWSTKNVYQETMDRLRKAHRNVFVLPECVDIDTREDLRELLSRETLAASSRTMSYLIRHKEDLGIQEWR